MKTLTILLNEKEGWIHTLTSEVTAGGQHQVVESVTHYPNGDVNLLAFATNYHTQVGINPEWTHIFRTERIPT